MRRLIVLTFGVVIAFASLFAKGKSKEVTINLLQTSDIHGNYYPYDFITDKPGPASLSRVASFVKKQRQAYGEESVLLLDGGDILQGQPSAYYYNFMDSTSTHICAAFLNFMKYDAMTLGNHDIEAGASVYNRFIDDCNFPVLAANIVKRADSSNFAKPYAVYNLNGVKVAVLGLITPAIPAWLPETLWKGLHFEDMQKTAQTWVPYILSKEKPDLMVGLFHAGQDAHVMSGKFNENASLTIAQEVPGFDVVMMGHDHKSDNRKVKNVEGKEVLIINPSNAGKYVSSVEIKFSSIKGKKSILSLNSELVEMSAYEPDKEILEMFEPQFKIVKEFVNQKVGSFTQRIDARPSFFGPSAFIDLIHELQLELTGADISLTAPLSINAVIENGPIYVRDMFNLYKYENMLYTMSLSGREIKGLLEMSYANWTNQMKSVDDHLLLLKNSNKAGHERAIFKNMFFNFDSAAGIIYTVDVTKPAGEKIMIASMADGKPFDLDMRYKVAVNSYRGNGGGELLTKGSGIPQDELEERIIDATDKDLRYYLMQYIESKGEIEPKSLNQWKFVPEEWTKPAAERDFNLIFGDR
ncbi:MAG: bifunctional metallophosphatase/5'-nucleotidase [Bacteroidales bacterium]